MNTTVRRPYFGRHAAPLPTTKAFVAVRTVRQPQSSDAVTISPLTLSELQWDQLSSLLEVSAVDLDKVITLAHLSERCAPRLLTLLRRYRAECSALLTIIESR